VILVVGATGRTGAVVVRELVERGAPVRGLTRSRAGAGAIEAAGAQAAVGDLTDPGSLARALSGVERVYLAVPEGPDQAALEANAIAVAEQAGAYHVVKLGMLGQAAGAPAAAARAHAESFDALQATSLRWTLLQPAAFMQNLLGGGWSLGGARVALVDARDVGRVAARALVEEGHESCTYALTGPEVVGDEEVAATVAEVTGRAPAPATPGDLADLYRGGVAAAVAPDLEALLDGPPTTLRAFAVEHREAIAPA
jgi:uncharacterized protein YbjT (DUF2867 family)